MDNYTRRKGIDLSENFEFTFRSADTPKGTTNVVIGDITGNELYANILEAKGADFVKKLALDSFYILAQKCRDKKDPVEALNSFMDAYGLKCKVYENIPLIESPKKLPSELSQLIKDLKALGITTKDDLEKYKKSL